jgi:hypothetical protein
VATPSLPQTSSFARTLLAVAVMVAGGLLSLVSASGVAYSEPQGAARLQEVSPALAVSVAVGVTTVAVALVLLRRRVMSPWLSVGALPAAVLVLNHSGVIG